MRLHGVSVLPKGAKSARALIGKRVTYLRHRDIDKSGRGYFFPQHGTVKSVHGRNIEVGDEWIHFSQLAEMVLTSDTSGECNG